MRTYNAYVEKCVEAQQEDGYLEAELMADACTREGRFGSCPWYSPRWSWHSHLGTVSIGLLPLGVPCITDYLYSLWLCGWGTTIHISAANSPGVLAIALRYASFLYAPQRQTVVPDACRMQISIDVRTDRTKISLHQGAARVRTAKAHQPQVCAISFILF